ncbi:hypothetical protein [Maricurvus nonylphenolicus]|uniref:hypothetical protein n=1 Tax=Maricurvus nonylphenolicus TaxID=1008307 RepID=UPI0036F43A0E
MSEIYQLLPTPAWVSSLVLLSLLMLVLYLSRESSHKAIHDFFHLLYSSMRLMARSLGLAEKRLHARNKEVLLDLGREHAERELQREFFRINKFVERDLGGYPKLQRSIEEQITLIDEDYRQSAAVPQPSPEWLDAVESLAKLHLKDKGQHLTGKILADVHQAAEDQQRDTLQSYREATAERHRILKKLSPYWRRLSNRIDEIGTHLQELVIRAQNIDRKMEQFEEITRGTDKAVQMLKASAVTQFSIALFVVIIAVGGAFFNFHLIALPMSEMVGASSRIAGVQVADLAALVIIFLEITMGIFLLETLHITRLFPIIGAMDDRMRRRMMWAFASILIILASVEAGLAFMRDQIAMDLAALRTSLAGAEAADESLVNSWIPLAANMTMGFILPLALTVVAIPLEYLLQTGRTVFGMLAEALLRIAAVTIRLLGNAMRHISRLLISIYDMVIMLPLWLEQLGRQRRNEKTLKAVGANISQEDPSVAKEPIAREAS